MGFLEHIALWLIRLGRLSSRAPRGVPQECSFRIWGLSSWTLVLAGFLGFRV